MSKTIPDGEGIIFADDGEKQMVLQINASDSQSVTAVLPTGGRVIKPVLLRKADFLKAYRPEANLSGTDGKLQMSKGHWKLALAGSMETRTPEPVIIEGRSIIADVEPLKSVQTEDSYGGSTWALFLTNGLAAVVSTYSLVCVVMEASVWPREPVSMQANAIYPLLNVDKPKLTVSEYAAGITGRFNIGDVDAKVYISLAKPVSDPPSPEQVMEMLPSKKHRLSVPARDLRTCIEGAKKTFEEEATNLTFSLAEAGLSISLASQSAALTETVPYLKKPETKNDKLVINTDVAVNAFKSVKELTGAKSVACMRWDENAVYIRIIDGDPKTADDFIGAIVIAASEE